MRCLLDEKMEKLRYKIWKKKHLKEIFVWPNDARWPARIIKILGC